MLVVLGLLTACSGGDSADDLDPSLHLATVGGLQIAVHGKPHPRNHGSSHGWYWTEDIDVENGLGPVEVDRMTRDHATDEDAQHMLKQQRASLLNQVDDGSAESLSVDVPGADFAAGTAVSGDLGSGDRRIVAVVIRSGNSTIYGITVMVDDTEQGRAVQHQIVDSLSVQ